MIEELPLVRNPSEDLGKHHPKLFEDGVPALVRRLTAPDTYAVEEVKQVALIDTGVEEEPEPAYHFCSKQLKCGHACKGVKDERKCMPCLHTDCAEAGGHIGGTNEDELCTICYTSELGAEACSRLSCGHVFHTNCIIQLLKHKWPTLRITFGFLACPSCN